MSFLVFLMPQLSENGCNVGVKSQIPRADSPCDPLPMGRWCSFTSLQEQEQTISNDCKTQNLFNFMVCKCSTLEPLEHHNKMWFLKMIFCVELTCVMAFQCFFLNKIAYCYLLITVFCSCSSLKISILKVLNCAVLALLLVLRWISVAGQKRHRSPPDAFSR